MLKNLIFILTLLSGVLFITSCGNDDIDCADEAAIASQLEAATSDYFAVLIAYSSDPSQANCERFKDETEKYLEFGESIRDCVPNADRAEYDSDLAEARQELNSLNCG